MVAITPTTTYKKRPKPAEAKFPPHVEMILSAIDTGDFARRSAGRLAAIPIAWKLRCGSSATPPIRLPGRFIRATPTKRESGSSPPIVCHWATAASSMYKPLMGNSTTFNARFCAAAKHARMV